jgi:hypothetical protein
MTKLEQPWDAFAVLKAQIGSQMPKLQYKRLNQDASSEFPDSVSTN